MIAGCLLAAGALPIWGQSGAPTLVIRIDDLGALHSVNEACIQTYRSGIARSVEVMPVAAWYPEAIKMLKENESVCRELIMVKLRADASQRGEIISVADIFRAKIVDVEEDCLMIELTGTKSKLEAFLNLLKDYEILELARTGITGLSRGSKDVAFF